MKKYTLEALTAAGGIAVGALSAGRLLKKTIDEKQNLSDKHLMLFIMMNQWVKVKQRGKNLSSYFEKHGYKRIAIYGMSYAGQTLVEELQGTDIEIVYGIDRNLVNAAFDIEIVSPDSALEEADAIVVTAIMFFDEIKEAISGKVQCPIVSLEDILYEV